MSSTIVQSLRLLVSQEPAVVIRIRSSASVASGNESMSANEHRPNSGVVVHRSCDCQEWTSPELLRLSLIVASANATTGPKHGQIAVGLHDVVNATTWRTVTMEVGTISDTPKIVNERAKHWVHFHGERAYPAHAQVVWDHRCRSTPDDAAWESSARAQGAEVLDAARRAFSVDRREPAR